MPLICITYMLQSIDKTTLSYAAVFDLRAEVGLKGTQYSWLGSLFYLGYLFWEYPTSLLLQRFPVAKFMSGTVIVWGIILMCHAAAHDLAGLAAARTFLGTLEASINPGTMIIFSMWYKRSEHPLRMGIWIGSAGIGYVLAGIASFGIGHIGGSLSSWKYMFLIWEAITTSWGVVIYLVLPDSPLKAGFLSAEERRGVIHRIRENETSMENKQFKKAQYLNARLAVIMVCLAPFLAGTIGTWLVPHSILYGRLVCLWISFSYTATWTLSMSVATANTAGHTKKVTTNAFLLIGYCLGNFISPFFFLAEQAPWYELGVGMMFFCIGVQVVSIVGLWVLLWNRNRSRETATMSERDLIKGYENGFRDLTDLENVHFEYVY
ncbi:MFS general substrate transporter [Pleomassaria siparia CBS 279.74]|uniref:MFS general substrate transporter n=1 Tax=Pleomassaria siparia CBS 279.74 TaxID=1314801 RepID=A0A6G1JV01_9PLEO|nr:MFS general substrate transporter [Pleomassaria siparia CBS 279.74]